MLLAAAAVAGAAFVLLRVRQRIHALRLEVTRVATLCGALQGRIDEVSDRAAEVEEALFFELYPAEVLPLIDRLDRSGRLTEGTADRLRRLTLEIRAEGWSDEAADSGFTVPRAT
ncbi:MAG: hypothetical protein OXG74_08060 [Acidobacteria bacterium]|nr:hypothetical protein [Acidobacteriota bacterium]